MTIPEWDPKIRIRIKAKVPSRHLAHVYVWHPPLEISKGRYERKLVNGYKLIEPPQRTVILYPKGRVVLYNSETIPYALIRILKTLRRYKNEGVQVIMERRPENAQIE